jgi:hypothetical protein
MGVFRTRNADEFGKVLTEAARQLRYAQSLAINNTLKDIQSSQRARMKGVFQIRQRGWFRYAVKIKPFANRRTLTGVISIDPPGHPASRMAITRHEEPGQRRPHASRALLVPVDARSGARRTIRKPNRPENLNLQRSRTNPNVYFGDRRTFMIRNPDGTGWIFRRRRKGQRGQRHGSFEGVDTLYVFRRRTPVHGGLGFMSTARTVFRRRYGQHFRDAYERALRTARW